MKVRKNRWSFNLAWILGLSLVVIYWSASLPPSLSPLLFLAILLAIPAYFFGLGFYVEAKGYSGAVALLVIILGPLGVLIAYGMPDKVDSGSDSEGPRSPSELPLSILRFMILMIGATAALLFKVLFKAL